MPAKVIQLSEVFMSQALIYAKRQKELMVMLFSFLPLHRRPL
jgi:hypothetical protein